MVADPIIDLKNGREFFILSKTVLANHLRLIMNGRRLSVIAKKSICALLPIGIVEQSNHIHQMDENMMLLLERFYKARQEEPQQVLNKNTPVRLPNDGSNKVYQVMEVLPSGRVRLWTMPGQEIMAGTYDPRDLWRVKI